MLNVVKNVLRILELWVALSAYSEQRDQTMRKAVAYKRLKKWKIIKPSPQKVVAVANEMWQLQDSEWNILVF